jgi:meckelin
MLGANPDTSQGLVFFPDDTGFSSVLLKGIEWHLIYFYIALFGLLDILMNSPIKAAVIIYSVDLILTTLRRHFGERNLSRKSLLDYKFLL